MPGPTAWDGNETALLGDVIILDKKKVEMESVTSPHNNSALSMTAQPWLYIPRTVYEKYVTGQAMLSSATTIGCL